MSTDVFIGYSPQDRALALALFEELTEREIGAWVDQSPDNDESWRDEMAQKIMQSTIVVLLISKNAETSNVIEKAFTSATRFQKLLIAVRIEDFPKEGSTIDKYPQRNWLDLFPNAEERLPELADQIGLFLNINSMFS